MAKRREIKSHKKATDLNLTKELEDLLGMSVGSDSMKLKSADDLSEPDEKVEKSSVAAVEATINYVNKLLNESDEELSLDDEDDDLPEDLEDKVADEEEPKDDEEIGDEGDIEECNDPAKKGMKPGTEKFFSEDDDLEDDADPTDDDGEDETLGDMEDEDGEFDDEDDEDLDDVSENAFKWLFEDDESMVGDKDPEDDEDGESSDGLSIDVPEDMDPNDISVSVGGSEYVPDMDDEEGKDDDDEDIGDLHDDKLGPDEEDEDQPVQESAYPFLEEFFKLGEGDDEDEDADPEEEPKVDDEEDKDEEEVTESAVMRALRRLMSEGERSDDPIDGDPNTSTGDAPVDSEADVDDSEAEEKDLKGDEGEVTDADIPIEKGTIQPEEAELNWMMSKLKSIMEGDDLESHSEEGDDGKVVAEPLDEPAEEMIGDISDELSDDGELTDTGNGAVEEDGDITLGSPDEADDKVDVDGKDVVSSNGEKYNDEEVDDEEKRLTDNYHMLMDAIKEAYEKKKAAKKAKKDDKKAKLKKVEKKKDDKKKAKKKMSENTVVTNTPEGPSEPKTVSQFDASQKTHTEIPEKLDTKLSEGKMKTLEDTLLGNFNKQEMTSVLRNLNNAFGTGKVAKEVRDSSVVSEVSVPKWSLPIAENASWDSLKAGKMLTETAYKSESKVDFDMMKKSHLYYENDGTKESDYKFPIASIVEGQAQIIPQAIEEATQLFASPSFITRFSESALKKIRTVLDFYNNKLGKVSPWKENKQLNVTEAAKITMIDRTQYNPYAVLKRLSEQEKAKNLINLRG